MEHYFFETPPDVAELLARYAPKEIRRLLEPSVGNGALLSAVLKKANDFAEITAVDINSDKLESTRCRFADASWDRYQLINNDFLEWSVEAINEGDKYDCVVMNPPFCSRKQSYVVLKREYFPGDFDRRVPIEIAFLLLSIELLEDGGTLLAIIPGSVVSSSSSAWFREYLLNSGTVCLVHELPRFTFPGVESKIYLLKYEKKKTKKKIRMMNHSLSNAVSMLVHKDSLCENFRLDYGFLSSRIALSERKKRNDLIWTPMSKLASVMRGQIKSPFAKKIALHTTDYLNGFWRASERHQFIEHLLNTKPGDLAIKRVGRNCVSTMGVVVDSGISVGDCVLVLRPMKGVCIEGLLLAYRTYMSLEQSKKELSRGTGASYISARELSELSIPYGISSLYPDEFSLYKNALIVCDFDKMKEIEINLSKDVFADNN